MTDLRCPIPDCPARYDIYDLYDHLADVHAPAELVERLVQLAPDLPYHRAVECEMCGTYGARPGDHPLCETCEEGLTR
ncbi:hypothetical protein AB0A77_28460 [Streptomyces varsoviensis]|uniref:hypothetical protein n=1 Tax=Streptomyces varsoviensis TaxID=67373 RepID=UPI0033FAC7E1